MDGYPVTQEVTVSGVQSPMSPMMAMRNGGQENSDPNAPFLIMNTDVELIFKWNRERFGVSSPGRLQRTESKTPIGLACQSERQTEESVPERHSVKKKRQAHAACLFCCCCEIYSTSRGRFLRLRFRASASF